MSSTESEDSPAGATADPRLRAVATSALTALRMRDPVPRTDAAADDPVSPPDATLDSALAAALDAAAATATCGCPDCLNATSLLAYLCDLLSYAVEHLRESGQPVTVSRLASRFAQPLDSLPVSCASVEDEVLQVRIAAEVLRAWLPNTATPAWYLQECYESLLSGIGTSLAELRAARTADPQTRQALAARLGFSVPRTHQPGVADALDELFDPVVTGLSEEGLEQLFGLRATTRPATYPDPLPGARLLDSRRDAIRQRWIRADHPANPPSGAPPLIEPDQLGPSDFVRASGPAFQLYSRRENQLAVARAELRAAISQFGLNAVLGDRFTSGLYQNTSSAAVIQLADRLAAGDPVDPDIAQLGLRSAEFPRFAEVVRLDQAGGPVTDAEWEDLYGILVAVTKRGLYPGWRDEEVNPPAWLGPIPGGSYPILLDPAVFAVRPPANAGGYPWRPIPWRSDPAARVSWERILRTRIDQQTRLVPDLVAVVAATEQRELPRLRDSLLDTLIGSPRIPAGTPDRADWLTRHLQIELKGSGCGRTTRAAQAVLTLQGVITGARYGLLEDPTLTLDAPGFDQEWEWLGSYAAWRSAMLVFLYPESALRPSLRRTVSPGFAALTKQFPAWAAISAAGADAAAAAYSQYFADICSLTLLGRRQWELAEPALALRVIRVARAGASGRLYFSAYTQLRRPPVSPGQPPIPTTITDEVFWDEVPGVPTGATLAGLTVHRAATGAPRVAAHLRWVDGQAERFGVTSSDGRTWWPSARPLDGIPGLVSTGGPSSTAVPGAAPVIADLDGTGRPQVVLQSAPDAAGRHLLQVLSEQDGGLTVTGSLLLPPGWQLADPPVVFTGVPQNRLLVINPGAGQIGLAGRDANGFRLVFSTADVPRANGSSGWPVNFGTTDQPAVFVAADPDGNGQRLLIFERMATAEWFDPIGTSVTSCAVTASGLTFIGTQALSFHIAAENPQELGFNVRYDGFTPVACGYGFQSFENPRRQDILVHTLRTTWWPTRPGRRPPANEETRHWYLLLRMDAAGQFQMVSGPVIWGPSINGGEFTDQSDLPALPGVAPWPAGPDDQFLPLELDPAFPDRQDILAFSPSRGAIGVLHYSGPATLVTRLHISGTIGTGPVNWPLGAGQQVLPFAPDGDRRQQLLLIDPARQSLAVTELTGTGGGSGPLGLQIRSLTNLRAESPDGDPAIAWPISPDSIYATADVDRDGRDEILVRGAFGRLGVLRPIPAPISTDTRPVSPSGVTLLQIASRRGPGSLDARRAQITQAYDQTVAAAGPASLEVALLDEAYYFVPMELGLRLAAAGRFGAALDWFASVYDYTRATGRKIAAKLIREEGPLTPVLERAADWLADPLNPHTIAATRPGAYTRFTILTITRCLIGWADAEFTRDTTESVSLARELYLAAADLLRAPELAQRLTDCADLIGRITLGPDHPELNTMLAGVQESLRELGSRDLIEPAVEAIEAAWAADPDATPAQRVAAAQTITGQQVTDREPRTVGSAVQATRDAVEAAMVALAAAENRSERAAPPPGPPIGPQPPRPPIDPPFPPGPPLDPPGPPVGAVALTFCVPPDREASGLAMHADLALRRIRACQTIAGLQSARSGLTESGALPSQPLPYRYAVLIERARQPVQLAAQVESSMLAALQQQQAAAYDELRARQDLALQRAGVRLKELDVTRATDVVRLAELQRDRSIAQRDYLTTLIDREHSAGTTRILIAYGKVVVEMIKLIAGAAAGGGAEGAAGGGGAEASGAGSGVGTFQRLGGIIGAGAEFIATAFDAAARERTLVEQRGFAELDLGIARQQVVVTEDGAALTGQDLLIAQLRAGQAQEVADFLASRFLGVALYEWMSSVLQDVYRFFLQQATSMGQLAQTQLAFERQQPVPRLIQDDYWTDWQDAAAAGVAGTSGTDRRGLTGSARLLADLSALDDYAFRTAQRRLKLSRSISLAALDPLGFERFRQTGELYFATPTALFDQDFPGHYLRLVSSVRVWLLALIPPATGIRATLATTGTSRVTVLTDAGFAQVPVLRGPETLVLTSTTGGTGNELTTPGEMLGTFEGIGVDTTWRFSMPPPANPINYAGIADVVVAIDYTALASEDLRQQVISTTDPAVRAERPFSLRDEFPDQWYDLHNPDQTAGPLQVSLTTRDSDFRPGLAGLVLRDITVAFTTAYDSGLTEPPAAWDQALTANLWFEPDGGGQALDGGSAVPTGGVMSTHSGPGNAAGWQAITAAGPGVAGTWHLAFKGPARAVFDSGDLDDILIILGYEGATRPWPLSG